MLVYSCICDKCREEFDISSIDGDDFKCLCGRYLTILDVYDFYLDE